MTTHQDPSSRSREVIAGGGVAGLETALALRALVGKRVAITLVAHEHDFVSVAQGNSEAFGGRHATRRTLSSFAGRFALELVHDRVRSVDHLEHEVMTDGGLAIPYVVLVLAVGATRTPACERVLTVR